MKTQAIRFMKMVPTRKNGNAYVEYFVLVTVTALAAIAFFDGGKFRGISDKVHQSMTSVMEKVVK